MNKRYDIILAHNPGKAKDFLDRIEGKKPVYMCALSNTETAKIPGLSAAGKNPEYTDYTPAADAELLLLGRCKCIPLVPVTPEGIPTPALITMSALGLAGTPIFLVSGGLRVEPQIPFIDLGGEPGEDIRTGKAVRNVEEVVERAKVLGETMAKIADYIVIGESTPGGTTTALAVLLSMGVDAMGRVSSSMAGNPHELKKQVVDTGMEAAGITFGSKSRDPLGAVACVGDPMMAAFAGLVLGAAKTVPVLMAGGTQMTAILAVIKALDPSVLGNIAIGTTRWIIADESSDIGEIVSQIGDVPVLAADIDFSGSRLDGLRFYEEGVVKEGVGAGGASIAAIMESRGAITKEKLVREIERNYERLVGGK